MFEHPCGYECERKFLLDVHDAQEMWALANAHLARRDEGRPPLHVCTTYFDTADLACYRSSRGPVLRRLRVREYHPCTPAGARFVGDRCFIELKQSHDGMRHKVRVPVRPDEAAARLCGLAGTLVRPCVTTWYRRHALMDPAARLRVTLDHDVLLCVPGRLGSGRDELDPDDILAHGPRFVLEVKFFDEPPTWMTDALAPLHEAEGFSKFLLGMSAVESARDARPIEASCTG